MTRDRRVTVTEAARNFSDLVNRVFYRGESAMLIRNGVTVARLVPPEPETVVTAGELLFGFEQAADPGIRTRRGAFIEAALEAIPAVAYGLAEARRHAALRAELSRRGKPIGPYDMLVAATALANDFSVAPLNRAATVAFSDRRPRDRAG